MSVMNTLQMISLRTEVFIDLKKVFDYVDHRVLISKIDNCVVKLLGLLELCPTWPAVTTQHYLTCVAPGRQWHPNS